MFLSPVMFCVVVLCAGLTPPENNPRENRIVILLTDGSAVNLCANSEDESM